LDAFCNSFESLDLLRGFSQLYIKIILTEFMQIFNRHFAAGAVSGQNVLLFSGRGNRAPAGGAVF